MTNTIKGSPEQEAIWETLLGEDTNVVVNSVAGSGKTFTGVEYCKREWRGNIAYVAFNRHIKLELDKNLANYKNVDCLTYHGLGFKALRSALKSVEVDEHKLDTILEGELSHVKSDSLRGYLTVRTQKLVSLSKQYQVEDRIDLERLVDHHALDLAGIEEQVYELVPIVLRTCRESSGTIDYDDMVWLPKQLGIRVPKYDTMLIDEAQDTNLSQQWLAMESAERLVVIGDRNQAIYGFRGSDVESINRLRDALAKTSRGVKEMSLSFTRRCPKLHVELAQQIVPQIKAMKKAPQGIIQAMDERFIVNAMRPGDLVMCRVNGDLASTAYNLIKKGIKAVVRGRDIGDGVVKLIQRAEKASPSNKIEDVLKAASEITSREVLKYNSLPNGRGAGRSRVAQDKFECMEALTEDASTSSDVIKRVNTIFVDFENDGQPKHAVVLGTVHRTKGLEANRVFVLRPELMPHPMAKQPWEYEQERNLAYVAVTRAVYNEKGEGELIWANRQPAMFKETELAVMTNQTH